MSWPKIGPNNAAASGKSTAAVSRSAIVSCRMLFPRVPQPKLTAAGMDGSATPEGPDGTVVALGWLTDGMKFLNHGLRQA